MKGYRFYLEFDSPADKHKGKHNGNIFALYHGEGVETSDIQSALRRSPEGFSAVLFYPNSPVAWTGTCWEYLQKQGKRISERQARKIHPELFHRLEQEN